MEFRRILVPVDFSENARAAVAYAIELAESLGSDVDVAHAFFPQTYVSSGFAYQPEPGVTPDSAEELLWQRAWHEFEDFAAPFENDVHLVLREGEPAQVVQRLVEEDEYDLVVIAPQGWTEHPRLGRDAKKMIRMVQCPVLVARI